jgi:hypothetical protein
VCVRAAGVDSRDSYEELCEFVSVVSEGSTVRHFVLHSRKCLLNGLSPHQNRTVPPLRREWVFALSRDFPHLQFSLNGAPEQPLCLSWLLKVQRALAAQARSTHSHPVVPQVALGRMRLPEKRPVCAACACAPMAWSSTGVDSEPFGFGRDRPRCCARCAGQVHSCHEAAAVIAHEQEGGKVAGVMIGRAAYERPWDCLSDADRAVYGAASNASTSRRQVRQRCIFQPEGDWPPCTHLGLQQVV